MSSLRLNAWWKGKISKLSCDSRTKDTKLALLIVILLVILRRSFFESASNKSTKSMVHSTRFNAEFNRVGCAAAHVGWNDLLELCLKDELKVGYLRRRLF